MLAQLAIGVIMSPYNSGSTVQQPYDSSNPFSFGGTATQTSDTLDGSPNATWDGRSAFSPPMDSVQDVRVKAFDTDSAFGHTGGGTINVVMKTGNNSLHGSLYWFNQPSNLTKQKTRNEPTKCTFSGLKRVESGLNGARPPRVRFRSDASSRRRT